MTLAEASVRLGLRRLWAPIAVMVAIASCASPTEVDRSAEEVLDDLARYPEWRVDAARAAEFDAPNAAIEFLLYIEPGKRLAVRDSADWPTFPGRSTPVGWEPPPWPAVDFSTEMVLVIGPSTTGQRYRGLAIRRVAMVQGELVVVTERSVQVGECLVESATPRTSWMRAVRLVPATDAPLRVIEIVREVPCADGRGPTTGTGDPTRESPAETTGTAMPTPRPDSLP